MTRMKLTQKRIGMLIEMAGRGLDELEDDADGEMTDAEREQYLDAITVLHQMLLVRRGLFGPDAEQS